MSRRNILLTKRQVALVNDLVRSGRYQDVSDVLREGLRLIEQKEAVVAARLEALRGRFRG